MTASRARPCAGPVSDERGTTVIADDDPRLSPLWVGRRAPFHAFRTALGYFTGAYDIRDGVSRDPMDQVVVSVNDFYDQPIVVPSLIAVSAFDDLLLAVQQLSSRHRAQNDQSGWMVQCNADRRMAVRDRWQAKGTDMDAFRADLRGRYEEAARLADQPDLA